MTSGIIVEQYRWHHENLLTMDPLWKRSFFPCYQYITSNIVCMSIDYSLLDPNDIKRFMYFWMSGPINYLSCFALKWEWIRFSWKVFADIFLRSEYSYVPSKFDTSLQQQNLYNCKNQFDALAHNFFSRFLFYYVYLS